MKKILILCFVLFALLGGGINGQSAKNNANITKTAVTKRGCFKDVNNNKICDNYEKKACVRANNHKNNLDSKKSTLCDGSGLKHDKNIKMNRKTFLNSNK